MRSAALALVLALAAACAPRDPSHAAPGGSAAADAGQDGSAGDDAGAGTPASPAPTAAASACDRMFEVLTSFRCGGAALRADLRAWMRDRYRQSCVARISLPDSSATAARLDACAAAAEAAACDTTAVPAACLNRPGARPDGSPCDDDAQCASTRCERAFGTPADGGPVVVPTCGRCAHAGRAGEPCGDAAGGGGCVDGTACAAQGSARVCRPVAYAQTGAACDGSARQCGEGLSCDEARGSCVALGRRGDACIGSGECALPLACVGGRCASPLASGASCTEGRDCAGGLVCDPARQRCVEPSWAAPGAPCSAASPCAVGACPGAQGVCPRVLDDGAPCTAFEPGETCAPYAACTDGQCTLEYASACTLE